ncbi:MAG: L,D-transpeptidase family protein [Proteobacteria bacterium]|nr:L,D-transpeptidase family protein [Pseudomonadota bacterium]
MNLRTPLRHGEYLWSDQGTASGPIHIWVDLTRQMISVFRGGTEIGTAVIVYGAPQMESPTGSYPILSKVSDYHSASYDAPMPYSLFITRTGVALHGSKMASDHATHGCIGLPLPFARALFGAAQQGDLVTIVKSTPSSRMPGHPTT